VGNEASDAVLRRLGFTDLGIGFPETFPDEESRIWRISLAY